MSEKEKIMKYILSADGYCLNPKFLIQEFLDDLNEKSNWFNVNQELIMKWEKRYET